MTVWNTTLICRFILNHLVFLQVLKNLLKKKKNFSAREPSLANRANVCSFLGRPLVVYSTYDYFSVQLSSVHSVVSDALRPHELQHARPACPSPTPGVHPNLCPLSRWCHPTVSSSVVPFSRAFNIYQHQGLFKWVSSSHQVAKVLEFQLQHQSFQWTPRTNLL